MTAIEHIRVQDQHTVSTCVRMLPDELTHHRTRLIVHSPELHANVAASHALLSCSSVLSGSVAPHELYLVNEGLEAVWLVHCKLAENLAVDLNVLLLQSINELRVLNLPSTTGR